MMLKLAARALRLGPLCVLLSLQCPSGVYSQSLMVGDININPEDFRRGRAPDERIAKCLACHGEHAGGDIDFGPETRFGTPALRGMRQSYLKQALIDYRTGSRTHQEMSAIASMLDEETIDFMARTFAAYPAPPLKSDAKRSKLAETDRRFRAGQTIALQGMPDKGVSACTNCHGALGEGHDDLGPRLAGQNSLYIRRQLNAYAGRTRRTERASLMQPVVTQMSSDEIEAVAYYYEQIVELNETGEALK